MTGAIFGWFLPIGVPFWVAILVLFVVYEMISWPLKALRHASYVGDRYHAPRHPFEGWVGIAVTLVLGYWAYHHVPELREMIEHIRDAWNGIVEA
jgi:hypothetical protein